MDNVFITPHCADRDEDFFNRTILNFKNISEKYANKEPLYNVVNKA